MTDYQKLLGTLKRCASTDECPPDCSYADEYGGCWHDRMVEDAATAIEELLKEAGE